MSDAAPSYAVAGLASPANLVTISRIIASPLLFVLILEAESTMGTSWTVFVLGWIFGASDLLDGSIARRQGTVSRSGAFLDPLADKIVVLGCMFSLVYIDRYHWFPVALIAARELSISAMRIHYSQQSLSIPARRSAKAKTVVQGLAVCAAIAPPLEDQQRFVDAFLWVAVGLTLYTGWQYVRDGSQATSSTGA